MIFNSLKRNLYMTAAQDACISTKHDLLKMFLMRMFFLIIFAFLLAVNSGFISYAEPRLQDTGKELVIVIDPGHGGENEGTITGNTPEKIMNLITAQAMYDELCQYDNVKVYMTRTDDTDLSLKKRAKFAASVDADFLFSLHYNASENHTLYGTEIWISSMAPYHAYSYQFGYSYLREMSETGLFLRGIKTKLNEEGTDYYGVIRESVALGVPAVIIEHCHVDEPNDIPYCETEEDWINLGKADALAVAKYFGLSSQSLGVDYSHDSTTLPAVEKDQFVQSTYRDKTPPDVCHITLSDVDFNTGDVVFEVTAIDNDSLILYYDYSTDGGETFSPMLPWPGTDMLEGTCSDTFSLSLQIPSGTQPDIMVRTYNFADLFTESNCFAFPLAFDYNEPAEEPAIRQDTLNNDTAESIAANANVNAVNNDPLLSVLIICLIIVIIIFFAVLVSQSIIYHRRRKKRRQRMKELEESIYQQR